MALENLSVRIGSQTADVRMGLDAVKRSLSQVGREAVDTATDTAIAGESLDKVRGDSTSASGALTILRGRIDEVADEMLELARSGTLAAGGMGAASGSAAAASGTFSSLAFTTDGLALSFGGLTSTLTGTVALLALVGTAATGLLTTLVPLAATLGGLVTAGGALAGAFGLVIGSGALAYGEDLQENYQERLTSVQDQIESIEEWREETGSLTEAQQEHLRELKREEQRLDNVEGPMSALQVRLGEVGSEIADIVAEWGSGFAPLIRDAINILPSLVRDILRAVGGMDQFAGTLREFGGRMLTIIPQIAGTLADLAREALPILIDGLDWLIENGPSIFRGMMETTREIAPLLLDVGESFVDALPAINEFGSRLLNVLVPALSDGIRWFGDFLDQIMDFTESEQFSDIMEAIEDTITGLGPKVSDLADNLGPLFDAIVDNAPGAIKLFQTIAAAALDFANFVIPIITWLTEEIGDLIEGINSLIEWDQNVSGSIQENGLLDTAFGGVLDLLGDTQIQTPGQAAGAAPTQFQGGGAAPAGSVPPQRVVVTTDDERFQAWVERVQDDRERRNESRRDRQARFNR